MTRGSAKRFWEVILGQLRALLSWSTAVSCLDLMIRKYWCGVESHARCATYMHTQGIKCACVHVQHTCIYLHSRCKIVYMTLRHVHFNQSPLFGIDGIISTVPSSRICQWIAGVSAHLLLFLECFFTSEREREFNSFIEKPRYSLLKNILLLAKLVSHLVL